MKLMHTLLVAAAAVALMTGSALADKTLVYCSEGSPGGFDPGFYEDGTTQDVQIATYEGLTKFKLGTTEVQPSLAEKWEVSKDGLSYTFHLRHGVKWQTTDWFKPTRDFNADDVVYSFQRQLDGKPYDSTQTYAYFGDMDLPNLMTGVKKIDDYTVEIDLKTPNSPFIADTAMPFAEIVSKEYADSLAAANNSNQMNEKPVGTGPFIFVDYTKDANIRYKANPDWWAGKVKIDNLVFSINTDATARLQALIAGDCQVMAFPNPADVASIKANKDLTAVQENGLNAGWVSFNVQEKPFDNPDVRKALDMAVDKDALIKAVFQGQAQAATTLLPPTMWGFNKSVKGYSHDEAGAKALLAKAGVKDLTVKLWAMPVSRPYMPDGKTAAQMIQADWAKIGVTATIYSVDWAEYLKDSKPHDRDGAVMIGWTGDNGDPDNFFTNNFGCAAVDGGNRSEWCNKEFDGILQQAAQETDQAKRAALYEKAQVLMNDDDPAILIAHTVVTMPMSKKVTGYTIDPFGLHHFETVDISQ